MNFEKYTDRAKGLRAVGAEPGAARGPPAVRPRSSAEGPARRPGRPGGRADPARRRPPRRCARRRRAGRWPSGPRSRAAAPARSTWRPSWRASSTPPRRSPTRPATSSSPSSACCWRWPWSPPSDAGRVLKDAGVNPTALNQAINDIRKGRTADSASAEQGYDALKRYARDLTAAAAEGKIDPVIGRDEEIRRTIQVLSRRTKNNPVLIGEPGVGKTAIAEGPGAAHRQGRRAREPEGQEAAGARHGRADRRRQVPRRVRGAAEGRARRRCRPRAARIILFIDELHTIVGAGKAEGAMDAGNLLKPALARGELHCVGATTLDEYRKHIEKDAALARRFQPVFVSEPTVEDTISILRGLKEKYEQHHGVRITDSRAGGGGDAVQPLHHRPLPARQGHRPGRRGGLAPEDGDRLQARGAGRHRPRPDADEDRARGPEEGERCGLQGPPGAARQVDRRARGEVARRSPRRWEAREEQARRRRRSSRWSSTSAAPSWSRRSAAAISPAPASWPMASSRASRRSSRRSRASEGKGAMVEEAVTPDHIAADRLALDRHSGRQDARGRAREAAAHGGGARQARRRPARGGRGRLHGRAARARRPAGPEPADRLVHLPGARPASARPS